MVMHPAPAKMLRFSTDDFPAHKRIDAYREIYSRTIVKHDIELLGDGPFRFEADMCSLPGLGLAKAFYSPCHRRHSAEHICSDDLLFGVATENGCVVRQSGREAVIGPGDAVLASAAHPVDVIIGTPSRHLSLRLPRAVLEARIADPDALSARRIPSSEGLSLLTNYVDALRFTDLTNSAVCDLAVAHVYDLVALVLGVKGDVYELAQQRGARAARRDAILDIINRRSSDRNLSAVTIAGLLGVTPRYVHLLLEDTGRSFTHHMQERRLEKAVELLRDPRSRRRKIADIAFEVGFADLSYFNRVFRRRFGATPSDIREAAAPDR
jgi:AraC-like DNA-binding protein